MSGALINRSLTTIRTELEFLHDSDVINKALYDALVTAIPKKYNKDMEPWGVDKISAGGNTKSTPTPQTSIDNVSESLASVSVQDAIAPPANPPAAPIPPRSRAPALGYCKALFNYDAQELGDLGLVKDDRIAVLEHLSPDWWKGYKQLDTSKTGVFPSNYVSVISEAEFKNSARAPAPPANENVYYIPEKTSSSEAHVPPAYQAPPSSGPHYGGYQVQQQQPSYGGYTEYPPPSTNYYSPQQQQQQLAPPQEVQQHTSGGSSHLKKFGSKLGNAAIFGAGATIGSDIVNLIF